MIYWRCKCGDRELRESGMPPARCKVCEKCGSTLATSPDTHDEPEPHKLVTRYHPSTGKPYQVCTNSGCIHREGYAEAGKS